MAALVERRYRPLHSPFHASAVLAHREFEEKLTVMFSGFLETGCFAAQYL